MSNNYTTKLCTETATKIGFIVGTTSKLSFFCPTHYEQQLEHQIARAISVIIIITNKAPHAAPENMSFTQNVLLANAHIVLAITKVE